MSNNFFFKWLDNNKLSQEVFYDISVDLFVLPFLNREVHNEEKIQSSLLYKQ